MKILKRIGKWFLVIFVLLNLAILVSGKTYLYKGVANTYLKGRKGPSIDEYQIFANREVKAGTPLPWANAKSANSKQLSEEHQKQFSDLQTVAYVIIKNDSIQHEEYWDGYGKDSYTNSFSMAKSFVSILIGKAISEGKIQNVDEPVGDFLPEFKEGDKSKVTIRHLLTMSSGIDFDEDYVNPLAYPAAAYYGTDLKGLTLKYGMATTPGKTFKYLSGNSELLGIILEKVTGMKLADYASEKLWKPIGAEHSAFWSLDHEDGMEKSYCCFNSNARDFARIGELYLDSGRYNGQQIIPVDYVLSSIRPADLVYEDGRKNDKYGYSWWLIPNYKGHSVFYARGILGQYILCIPDEKMVVVRLGRQRDKDKKPDHPLDVNYYLDAALEMYGN